MRDFYVVTLSKPGAAVARYALYTIDLVNPGQSVLSVVWPKRLLVDGRWLPVDTLLPCQVFFPKKRSEPNLYPAYHFAVKAVGYSPLEYFKDALQKGLGEPVRLFALNGWGHCLY
jgi:hypothetical protein